VGALMALTALDSLKADILRIDFMCDSRFERAALAQMSAKARHKAF
jgi:hypothetical protein